MRLDKRERVWSRPKDSHTPLTTSSMTSAHHLVVITGANRGFGASVAHSYLRHSGASAISFVLVGRNEQGLATVLHALQEEARTSSGAVTVKGVVVGNVDLADTEHLEKNLERIQVAVAQLRDEASQYKVCDKLTSFTPD